MSALANMAEIDLIPADYRTERVLLRLLRRVGILMLVIVCGSAALAAGLREAAVSVRSDVNRLDAAAAGVELQRAGVATLEARKAELQGELAQLSGLRDGNAILASMTTVGRALAEDRLWFLEWRFERIQPAADGSQRPSAPPGSVRVQMGVRGQALDHAAISSFVGTLLAAPGVEDVRIVRTARQGEAGYVDFDLLIATDGPGSP